MLDMIMNTVGFVLLIIYVIIYIVFLIWFHITKDRDIMVSDKEYEEFLKYVEDYNSKKKEKKHRWGK
jgi:uncharacterized membrane protein YukC